MGCSLVYLQDDNIQKPVMKYDFNLFVQMKENRKQKTAAKNQGHKQKELLAAEEH